MPPSFFILGTPPLSYTPLVVDNVTWSFRQYQGSIDRAKGPTSPVHRVLWSGWGWEWTTRISLLHKQQCQHATTFTTIVMAEILDNTLLYLEYKLRNSSALLHPSVS